MLKKYSLVKQVDLEGLGSFFGDFMGILKSILGTTLNAMKEASDKAKTLTMNEDEKEKYEKEQEEKRQEEKLKKRELCIKFFCEHTLHIEIIRFNKLTKVYYP